MKITSLGSGPPRGSVTCQDTKSRDAKYRHNLLSLHEFEDGGRRSHGLRYLASAGFLSRIDLEGTPDFRRKYKRFLQDFRLQRCFVRVWGPIYLIKQKTQV